MSVVSTFVVLLAFVALSQSAKLSRNCNFKWSIQYKCWLDGINKAADKDTTFRIPNVLERNRMRNAVANCFKKNGCNSNPLPSDQETKARQQCFNDAKKALGLDMQNCVRQEISDWNLPGDIYDGNDWVYVAQRVDDGVKNPKKYCTSATRQALDSCMKSDVRYDFNPKPPARPAYYCQQEAQCWSASQLDCQNAWEYQVTPSLCRCTDLKTKNNDIKKSQDAYKQCMSNKGVNAPINDPALTWINDYVKSFCQPQASHVCKRERDQLGQNNG